ncbi:MAG: TatD family deoxyribonuclease [Proteobacteria bacterium]|nr:TatD family deoxyribonuclease [Pseudomonadota bacterium]
MAEFYDTHAHLDFPDFTQDVPQLVARAAAAGITRIISIGTDLESSARAVALAEEHPAVFAAVGWHPNEAVGAPKDFRAELRALARHPKVVAIGETGLDHYRLPSGKGGTPEEDALVKARQAEVFLQQLEVAAEVGLNCVIHTRGECFDETLRLMEPFAGRVRGVFHCFIGTPEQMQRVMGINSLVSFTGIATFKNAQNVRDSLAATPTGRFMLETDAPFLAPVPYRGKRCEPAYVKEIAVAAAQLRGCTLEELSAATCAAAREFFPKMV